MTVVRRTAHRAAIAGLVSALAATATTAIVVVSPPGDAGQPQPPRAHVWVTTPDGAERMHDRGTVSFAPGAGSDRLTITVDPSLRYQKMDGFGASITDSSASVLSELDPATRDATMRDLFVRPTGCRSCGSRSAPPTSSTARTTPSTTCLPARPTTRSTTSRSSTTRPRSCRCSGRHWPSTPPQGDGDAVEPAGLDEDQRLAGGRPADRRPADLPGVRRLPGQVRAGVRGGRGSRLGPHHPERAAEPAPPRATPAPTCRPARPSR